MTKPLPSWTYHLLCACGLVLIISMFVPWVDFMEQTVTGFGVAWHDNRWLFLVPLAGAFLIATAASRSELTRLTAISAGILIAGYVMYSFAKSILIDGGLDTWLIFGGAGVCLAGGSGARRDLRLLGGVAVLAGFFAPWDNESLWRGLTEIPAEISGVFGLRLLWLVPTGGMATILGALSSRPRAGVWAVVGGVAVFGSIGWVGFSALHLVLGYGAWSALGASAIALAIGVLVPGAASRGGNLGTVSN
ncbi:MAG: hypothetical protein AB7P03_22700 [Kofleriaceae bacterium]